MSGTRKIPLILTIALCLGITGFGRVQEQQPQSPPDPSAVAPQDEFTKTFAQARSLLVSGKVEEAIATYNKAATIKNGKCPECFYMIGQIYFQMSQYDEAAVSLRKAVALKPENEAALSNYLGVALYLQDDRQLLPEAIAAFKRAIELSGDKLPKAYFNLGHALLKADKKDEGVAALKRYLEVEPQAANAEEVKRVIANPKLAGAKVAADFSVKGAKGEEIALQSLRGKVVLLDFWAVWCGPCREEMPHVKRIAKRFANDKFVILGISLDRDRKSFDNYLKQEGMTWQQFYDGNGWENKIAQLYGVTRIPHTVLLDQDGLIRATGLRGRALENKIADLLKQMSEPVESSQK